MAEDAPTPTHLQLFLGMQQVALSSFGGGLSAWSERIVVEERQWMGKEEFITGLTVARLFPGPNQGLLKNVWRARFECSRRTGVKAARNRGYAATSDSAVTSGQIFLSATKSQPRRRQAPNHA